MVLVLGALAVSGSEARSEVLRMPVPPVGHSVNRCVRGLEIIEIEKLKPAR